MTDCRDMSDIQRGWANSGQWDGRVWRDSLPAAAPRASEPDWRERYLALHKFIAQRGGVAGDCGLMELRQIDIWAGEARREIWRD